MSSASGGCIRIEAGLRKLTNIDIGIATYNFVDLPFKSY